MSLRLYLLFMTIATTLCWAVWFIVISNINPDQGGMFGYLLFYISLFLSLSGTISIIGFLIRKKIDKKDIVVFHHVRHTFRQGILVSSLMILALFMQQLQMLNWLTGILGIAVFLILESIFFAGRKYKNRDFV